MIKKINFMYQIIKNLREILHFVVDKDVNAQDLINANSSVDQIFGK